MIDNEARELIQQRLPRHDKENLRLALTSLIAEVQALAVHDDDEDRVEGQQRLQEELDQLDAEAKQWYLAEQDNGFC